VTATRRDKGVDIEEREMFAGVELGVRSTYRRQQRRTGSP
jgi:hypothetical protein